MQSARDRFIFHRPGKFSRGNVSNVVRGFTWVLAVAMHEGVPRLMAVDDDCQSETDLTRVNCQSEVN